MRIKYLLVGLAAVSLLTGCGKKVEFEGEPWYANVQRQNREIDIDKEYPTDSMADSWEYGISPEAGHDLAEDGEYYYVANPTDGNKLYRIKKDDGFTKEKLLDVGVGDVNVVNDRIYFSNYDENALYGTGIYSMDVNDREPEIITDHYPLTLRAVNDWLYFIDYNDKNLYKIHNAGRELIKLTESECSGLYLCENEICTWQKIEEEDNDDSDDEEYELISLDVNGNELHSYGIGKAFAVESNELYISREDGLWRVSMDDPDQQELVTDEISEIHNMEIAGGEIYYLTDEEQLGRYTLSTGENKIYTSVNYVSSYYIFDEMIEILYQVETDRYVSVNRISDGSSVAFFE